MKRLYSINIDSPHIMSFGLETTNDIVSYAAPIAKWTLGKHITKILNYYIRKNAIIYLVEHESKQG